jgi:uncharacterized protein (DUF427 family)
MKDYPDALVPPGRVERAPRRVRGVAGGEVVVDSTRALYGWEVPYYPQYYFPIADVRGDLLVSAGTSEPGPFGEVEVHGLRCGEEVRTPAARLLKSSSREVLKDTVRFEWGAVDAWYEEDERVFVHPRNPYVRVDALRSTRAVKIELGGVALAESSSPVMVFETGLPTRYYINRTEIDFSHLVPTDTVTECPYKGRTGGYWSVHLEGMVYPDLAWTYEFPTRQLQPIAGLVAFYNEKVDISIAGERMERPRTPFS